jgi:nucleotide-binding universal stress UspA family protein
MTIVVPFDGSELAEAALVRATEFGNVFDEDVVAVSVIPKGDNSYAREHGWIEANEEFDLKSIVSTLHEQVTDACPTATFRHRVVDRYAPSASVARRLRGMAREEDASMVFIGSENAGRVVTGVSSVAKNVTADVAYDVVIIRDRRPTKIAELDEASPHERSESKFRYSE